MMKDSIAKHQIELAAGLKSIKWQELDALRAVRSPRDVQGVYRLVRTDKIFDAQYVEK